MSAILALCGPAAEASQPPADQGVAAESGWSDDDHASDGDWLVSEAEDRFVCLQLGEFLLVWLVAVFLVSTRQPNGRACVLWGCRGRQKARQCVRGGCRPPLSGHGPGAR
jgi:hypothetical protein